MPKKRLEQTGEMELALSAKGTLLGIPMEAAIVHSSTQNILSGTFVFTAQVLLDMLNTLSPGLGNAFRQSPCYAYGEAFQGRGALVWNSGGTLAVAGQSDSLCLGLVHQDGGTMVLLTSRQKDFGECAPEENSDFSMFLDNLKKTAGAVDFRLAYKNGNGLTFQVGEALLQKLEKAAFEQQESEFYLPNCQELNSASVLVFAGVEFSKSDMGFLNMLSEFLPEGTRASLTAAFGNTFFLLIHIEHEKAALQEGKLDIRRLDCSFVLCDAPRLSLAGELAMRINDGEYLFLIQCTAQASQFSIAAEYTGRTNPVSIGSHFRLCQLGLSIGCEKGQLLFGGWGVLQLGYLDLFALLFMRSTGSVLSLTALGLALNRMDFPMFLSLFGINLPGADDFDFLIIEPFPLKAKTMNTSVLQDLSEAALPQIAEAFSAACDGSCGGRGIEPVTADKLLVRKTQEGWMLTDEKNIRHYAISSAGQITLAPQLYFCTEDSVNAGSYTLYRGIFVCASLVLLGIRINFFARVDEKCGMEALVNIAPLSLGWLTLGRASQKRAIRGSQELWNKSDSVTEQYLYDGEGPTLYVCMKRNDFVLYLDASLNLLGLIQADAFLTCEAGQFHLDAGIRFFGLSARLTLIADYGDFNSGHFYFSVTLDLSFFQDIAQAVIAHVRKFVSEAQGKLASAQEKLDYAQRQVLGLTAQIDSVNRKISQYASQLHNLRWWQFYKAPYLLLVIGGLELEKAGIYIALGAAYAALEIAKSILELLKQAVGAIGWLIQKLAEAVSSIFYLKSITLALDAAAAGELQADMSACFTLFGRDYNTSIGISLKGDVKSSLHGSASATITDKADTELQGLKNAAVPLRHAAYTLGSFLKDSEFPYKDCAGYATCLLDGLDFADKAAVASGQMQAAYEKDFGCQDPLSERHAGQMHRKLTEVKAQWQGVFTAVQGIDCGDLLDEAREQLSRQNALTAEKQTSLEAIEQEWQSLQSLQTVMDTESGRIAELDTRYLQRKEESSRIFLNQAANSGMTSEDTAEAYYTDLFYTYSHKKNALFHDVDGLEGFSVEDKETYFINPANEPVLDDLFAQVCEDSEHEAMHNLKREADKEGESKRLAAHYRIRI